MASKLAKLTEEVRVLTAASGKGAVRKINTALGKLVDSVEYARMDLGKGKDDASKKAEAELSRAYKDLNKVWKRLLDLERGLK